MSDSTSPYIYSEAEFSQLTGCEDRWSLWGFVGSGNTAATDAIINVTSAHPMVNLSPDPITNTGTVSLNYITSDGTDMTAINGPTGTGLFSIPSVELNKTLLTDKSAGTNLKFLSVDDTNNTVGYTLASIPTQIYYYITADSIAVSHDGLGGIGSPISLAFIAERVGRRTTITFDGNSTAAVASANATGTFIVTFSNPSLPALITNFRPEYDDVVITSDCIVLKNGVAYSLFFLMYMLGGGTSFAGEAHFLSAGVFQNFGMNTGDLIQFYPFSITYISKQIL